MFASLKHCCTDVIKFVNFLTCPIICALIFTAFYTMFLYTFEWAKGVAIASMVYFLVGFLGQVSGLVIGLVGLCRPLDKSYVCCPNFEGFKDGFGFFFKILAVIYFVVIQIGVHVIGFVLALELYDSEGKTCPIYPAHCKLLIVCYFLVGFFGLLRRKKCDLKSVINNRDFTAVEEEEVDGMARKTIRNRRGGELETIVETNTVTGEKTTSSSTKQIEGYPPVPELKTLLACFLLDPNLATLFRLKQARHDGAKESEVAPLKV